MPVKIFFLLTWMSGLVCYSLTNFMIMELTIIQAYSDYVRTQTRDY